MIGQVSPYLWLVEGDPTNLALSIIDAPKGAIVIDTENAIPYVKTTGFGDNSAFTSLIP